MKVHTILLGIACCALLASCAGPSVLHRGGGAPPDPLTGDWEGHRVLPQGAVEPLRLQVIAMGEGKYQAVLEEEFGKRNPDTEALDFTLQGEQIVFTSSPDLPASLSDGVMSGSWLGQQLASFQAWKQVRLSPTLGAKPPPGAIVLFDGKSLDGWKKVPETQTASSTEPVGAGWKIVDGNAMEVVAGTGSIITRQSFSDCRLHLEFRTPFMPTEKGQARGNSGVYLQGRYEIQVLDSYGLTGEDNECGGIYKVAKPRINMCAPPGQWQTYDISFTAPRFDPSGIKTNEAVISVLHNGVPINENLTIPAPTGGAADLNVQSPGGLFLQDHGNPVQYRNIWIVEGLR